MRANPPGYLWSKLSDERLQRYELLKNLHIKLYRSTMGTGTQMRLTGVTTIALLVLHTRFEAPQFLEILRNFYPYETLSVTIILIT